MRNAGGKQTGGFISLNKCRICGKKAIALTQLCSACMQKAAVEPEQIERVKQLDGILNLTAGET